MLGFGMLFLGLDVISSTVTFFKTLESFRSIFLVKNDLILLLNGIIITGIVQSSSAVTSVMIILASNGLLSFESSMFLILGANIGTCLSVIVCAMGRPVEARRTAFFNLAFNLFGSLILLVPLSVFKSQITNVFLSFSGTIERQIANFHTVFNLFVAIILLPILKPFTNLISKLITNKEYSKIKKSTKSAKIYLSSQ
jgi:phosphate:Na+ symporter